MIRSRGVDVLPLDVDVEKKARRPSKGAPTVVIVVVVLIIVLAFVFVGHSIIGQSAPTSRSLPRVSACAAVLRSFGAWMWRV